MLRRSFERLMTKLRGALDPRCVRNKRIFIHLVCYVLAGSSVILKALTHGRSLIRNDYVWYVVMITFAGGTSNLLLHVSLRGELIELIRLNYQYWVKHSLQLFSGDIPFYHIQDEETLQLEILHGTHPVMSAEHKSTAIRRGFSASLNSIMKDCWDHEPVKRPNMETILNKMTWLHNREKLTRSGTLTLTWLYYDP